ASTHATPRRSLDRPLAHSVRISTSRAGLAGRGAAREKLDIRREVISDSGAPKFGREGLQEITLLKCALGQAPRHGTYSTGEAGPPRFLASIGDRVGVQRAYRLVSTHCI